MKTNLNSCILDSKTYLTYLFENNQIKHVDYDKHIDDNKDRWSKIYDKVISITDIDMNPYFYTLDIVSEKEKQSFFRFFCNYINIFHIDYKSIEFEDCINNVVGSCVENIAIFIIAMQYFFL